MTRTQVVLNTAAPCQGKSCNRADETERVGAPD
jgi:hypothetical protein